MVERKECKNKIKHKQKAPTKPCMALSELLFAHIGIVLVAKKK